MTFGLVKHNNNSISAITSAGQLAQGKMTLIKEQTASSSSSISFVDGSSSVVLDSTYPIYLFKFINIHPATDNTEFQFNGSDDDSSHSYDVTKTTTFFRAYHDEGDSFALLEYRPNADQAQGTALQPLNYADSVGTDNDMCFVGTLHLFDPSNTTFVKHFISTCNSASQNPMPTNTFIAGYFNTTSAITGIRFQQNTGNIDIGTIKMYGVS